MFIRNPYNYDGDVISHQTGLECVTPSKAEQSYRDECDINAMIARFARGALPPPPDSFPTPPDFDSVFDFHSAMNQLRAGREAFDRLPSKVRARFQNDPGQYLDFIAREENLFEAESLGIVSRGTAKRYYEAKNGVSQNDTINTSDSGGSSGSGVDNSTSGA